METRYFLEMDGTAVKGSVIASRNDWETVEIPSTWLRVSEEIYNTTPQGSVQQSDGTFTPPPAPQVIRRLSKFTFLSLLTPSEYVAMFGQQSDPTLAYGVALFTAAPDPFNIDDPRVASMLDYCVSVGALTAERRASLWASMEAAAS